MATYTPNYNLCKPEGTDDFDSFLSEFGNNMDTIDANLGGGGGSGGHTIIDPLGQNMPQRTGLQFIGANVTDDSVNDKTVVTITGGGGSINYSYTEQVVGTAEDGRPLYQITVDCGTLPNNTTKNVAHGISDLDYIEHFWGSAKNPNNGIRIPLPYVYGNTRCLQVYADSTNIKLISTENMSGYTISRVTVQYTKTTDL